MDHIRRIEELLGRIEKTADPGERNRFIKSLFLSEWRPEYMAGAFALGKYARKVFYSLGNL